MANFMLGFFFALLVIALVVFRPASCEEAFRKMGVPRVKVGIQSVASSPPEDASDGDTDLIIFEDILEGF